MATASILRAVVTADTGAAQAKLAAFGRSVNTVGTSGSRSLRAFQAVGTIAFAAAGLAAIKFGADSVNAYRESQVVLAQLQNVISKTPGYSDAATAAFQKQATALQDLTGFEDEQILSADANLVRFKLTQQQVQDLIPVILDYARATGTDAATASEAIGKALLGNSRALKAVGIDFHATGDRGKDLATIMDLLKGKVGGAAEAFGKTSQGKIEIFRAKLNDLQETIGKVLLPVLDGAVGVLGTVLDIVQGLPGPVKVATGAVIGFAIAIKGISLATNLVKGAFKDLSTGFAGASSSKDSFAKNVTGTLVPAAEAGGLSLGEMAIEALALAGPLIILEGLMYTNKQAIDKLSASAHDNAIAIGQGAVSADVARGSWRALAGQANRAGGAFDKMANSQTVAGYEARRAGRAFFDEAGAATGARAKSDALKRSMDQVAGAMSAAAYEASHVATQIRNIPQTWKTDYYFVQHGYIPGGPPQHVAQGGLINMQPGGSALSIVELTRPTMIAPGVQAGEGGREFVLPANQRGEMWIKDAVRDGLSEGIAQFATIVGAMGGGAGDVYLDGDRVGRHLARQKAMRGGV